jgi:hypothetical protein
MIFAGSDLEMISKLAKSIAHFNEAKHYWNRVKSKVTNRLVKGIYRTGNAYVER